MTAGPRLRVAVATRLFTPEVGAAAFRLQALVDGLVAAGLELARTVPSETVTHLWYRVRR